MGKNLYVLMMRIDQLVFYIFHKRGKIHLNLQLWVSERNIIEWALEKNFLKEPDILHKKKGLVLYK